MKESLRAIIQYNQKVSYLLEAISVSNNRFGQFDNFVGKRYVPFFFCSGGASQYKKCKDKEDYYSVHDFRD